MLLNLQIKVPIPPIFKCDICDCDVSRFIGIALIATGDHLTAWHVLYPSSRFLGSMNCCLGNGKTGGWQRKMVMGIKELWSVQIFGLHRTIFVSSSYLGLLAVIPTAEQSHSPNILGWCALFRITFCHVVTCLACFSEPVTYRKYRHKVYVKFY